MLVWYHYKLYFYNLMKNERPFKNLLFWAISDDGIDFKLLNMTSTSLKTLEYPFLPFLWLICGHYILYLGKSNRDFAFKGFCQTSCFYFQIVNSKNLIMLYRSPLGNQPEMFSLIYNAYFDQKGFLLVDLLKPIKWRDRVFSNQ